MCVTIIHVYAYRPMREIRLESENVKENTDVVWKQRGMVSRKEWLLGQRSKNEGNRQVGKERKCKGLCRVHQA